MRRIAPASSNCTVIVRASIVPSFRITCAGPPFVDEGHPDGVDLGRASSATAHAENSLACCAPAYRSMIRLQMAGGPFRSPRKLHVGVRWEYGQTEVRLRCLNRAQLRRDRLRLSESS